MHSPRRISVLIIIVGLLSWMLTAAPAQADTIQRIPCTISKGHKDKHVHGTVSVKYKYTKDRTLRVAWIYVSRTEKHHHSVKGPDYFYDQPWITITDLNYDHGFGYMNDKLMADDAPMPRGRKPQTTRVRIIWDVERTKWTYSRASCMVIV